MSNNEREIEGIKSAFLDRYPGYTFIVKIYENKYTKEIFEEQIENRAFMQIQTMVNNKEKTLNTEDIFVGFESGIKKDMDNEDEEGKTLFYGVMNMFIMYDNMIYTNESEKVYINTQYNEYVNMSQINQNVKFGKRLSEIGEFKEIQEDNWYIVFDPRKDKIKLIELCTKELLDNIKLK